MKKIIALLVAMVMVLAIAGCAKPESAPEKTETTTNDKQTESTQDTNTGDNSTSGGETAFEGGEVRVYVTSGGEKFITFNESTPWSAPDGVTYKKGDLLPTWQHVAQSVGITITDATPKSGSDEKLLLEQAAATKFEDANVFMGSPRTLSDYGIQGYFVPLNEHFDSMPNFKAFLDANPAVVTSLTQADGNIYLTPYFDDIDQLERMFLMRIDWVEAILDEEAPAFDTSVTIDTEYDAFYNYGGSKTVEVGTEVKTVNIAENIITTQNNLSTKNGETLAQALRDYIDETYMNDTTGYTKRSQLFTSSEAAYDGDELIALMRAVKANPKYLTGEDKDLTIFYVRRVKDHKNMRYLSAIWGVRGTDSKNGYYYLNEDDQLVDGRLEDEFLTALDNLHKLYNEGLILSDYDQAKGQVTDFRKLNFQTNDGFISYDYAASTVAQHDLIADNIDAYGTVFEPVVSAAAPWFSGDFTHFQESNRSVKTSGGWGIATHTEGVELESALRLLDYPFSEEGLEVMTFGPQGLYWNERMEFAGKEIPKLIEQFATDRNELAGGNWSNFMRGFVGATFGVGHVKQTIAIEMQVSNEHYANGIQRISDSNTMWAQLSGDAAPETRIVPTIFPLNEDQVEALSTNTFGTYYDEWQTRIIKYGFGTQIPNSTEVVPTKEGFVEELKTKGIELETKIMNQAYDSTK